ncbi:SpoIIE family protein phosphatase [Chloroflexi bacterium TSY]|nr:SpoIIE family protein phosphatase [Chloroflexi bacterium TSY]
MTPKSLQSRLKIAKNAKFGSTGSSAIGVFSLAFNASGETSEQDEYFIRVMLGGVDEQTQSVILTTPVTEGTRFWMTHRNYEKIRDGVDRIGQELKAQLGENPADLVFHFECTGRGQMFLRDRQKLQLLNQLQHKVGADVPWLGLYCHFEIGPMQQQNQLHNYTSVVAALYSHDEQFADIRDPQTYMVEQNPTDKRLANQTQLPRTDSSHQQNIYHEKNFETKQDSSFFKSLLSRFFRNRRLGKEFITESGPLPNELANKIEQLENENRRLAEEVKQLVETERDLYKTQEQLDVQFRLYRQLYETGKKFNSTIDATEVCQIAAHFVLYGLNFERCLILHLIPDESVYRIAALDGYYDEEEKKTAEALLVSTQDSILSSLLSENGRLICIQGCEQETLLTFGRLLGMDEYILLPLGGEATQPTALLAVGNTMDMASQHTRVNLDPESDTMVGLADKISQASNAIENATFYTAVEESEKKFRSLFEDSQDAIFITAPDGQLIDVNPAMLNLFGYTQNELRDLNAKELYLDPEDRLRFRKAVDQTGSVQNFEVIMRKKNGTQMACLLSATVQHASDETILAYQGIIRDITVQRQNERLKVENLRLQTELGVAQRLQQMVLPGRSELDAVEGLDIAGYMDPADEVGGDYYDVLSENGAVKIGIGDVTDHGLESGVVMLMIQAAVRTLLNSGETDPVRFLDILNRTVYGNVQRMNTDHTLTLSLIDYASKDNGGELRLSGQHEEMIVVRRDGGLELVDTSNLGFPIGLVDDIADLIYHTTVELQPGDGVILFTDGITEAENLAREQYGMKRLCQVARDHWSKSADAIKEAIITNVHQHIGEQEVFDDITLVVAKQQ